LSFPTPRGLLLRLALPAVLVASGAGALLLSSSSPASAALPESDTNCSGQIANDPGGKANDEPNLLDYTFSCDTDISAYTIIVSRLKDDQGNIDDYSPTANVVYPSPYSIDPALSGTVSGTEAVDCGGAIPSDGINCYATNGTVETVVSAGNLIEGSVDPVEQYCAFAPKGAKAGTATVPRAIVEIVVTDSTGAQDGPFELFKTKACAKVPAVVPAKKVTKKPTKKKKTTTKKKK
jgi:hypothetical protein